MAVKGLQLLSPIAPLFQSVKVEGKGDGGDRTASPDVHQHQTLMIAGLADDDCTCPALNPSVG